jgi:hypothetical protein
MPAAQFEAMAADWDGEPRDHVARIHVA